MILCGSPKVLGYILFLPWEGNREDWEGIHAGSGLVSSAVWKAHCAFLSSPHRDPSVRWLQPAYPGQVHPEGPGQTLAQLLPQVCGLPDAAGRQVLLQGRERLLQGRLLQVSPNPGAASLPAPWSVSASPLEVRWEKGGAGGRGQE